VDGEGGLKNVFPAGATMGGSLKKGSMRKFRKESRKRLIEWVKGAEIKGSFFHANLKRLPRRRKEAARSAGKNTTEHSRGKQGNRRILRVERDFLREKNLRPRRRAGRERREGKCSTLAEPMRKNEGLGVNQGGQRPGQG